MTQLLALLIGYLLGSVLPADLFGRARGVDLREVGTRNPGATNALQELGLVPGLVTGAYDGTVGLVSMYIASRMGLSEGWIYLAGFAAIVGHIFPVFFGFHGGQGMAAATGMLLYGMSVALANGWLSPWGLLLLAILAVVVFALTRSASVVGVVAVPLLELEILLAHSSWQFAAFMAVLAGFIWTIQLGIVLHEDLFHLAAPVREQLARFRSSPH